MPPLILITNDDGIHSPGLHAAITALTGLGELLIIAPTEQQSGMSRSLATSFDGRIHSLTLPNNGEMISAYHMNGTPAQAVIYGVVQLAQRRPDLVVSGINFGENLGSNTMISGTVGAALQGGDMGIRSLALSLEVPKNYHYNHGYDVDWSGAVYWLQHFARLALEMPVWPEDVVALKIDIPSTATQATPWRITRQSRQPYYISTPKQDAPSSAPLELDYEIAIDLDTLEADSDIYAFAIDHIVSVTPLSANLTARISLPAFETEVQQFLPSP
ncbi:MAG: 5'/3'-nucleotidase SurE [Chloroflexi bacterium]|nr:5'/3'-nucleotidase SurE [Chloroflexota bacterium]